VLEKCFAGELSPSAWLPKLKEIIPSYGISLIDDAKLLQHVRAETAQVLKVENIDPPAGASGSARKTQREILNPRLEKISYGQDSR
jgi:malate dehydrogenase (quinone)